MTLNPEQLAAFLAETIPAGEPVLITGAPGIGKSDVVAQAAEQCGADVILSHPAIEDPTDSKGLPWVSDGEASFLPFGELRRALSATERTVWFLDDLGQGSPAVQAAYMQLVLARRVNGHALPDCVTFVAATNRRTDKAGVSGILEPLKSRFTIVELAADLDSFCNWGFQNNLHPMPLSFVRFRPDLLSDFQPTADMEQSPSPRGWAAVSRLLNLQLEPDVQLAAIAGRIGEAAAAEFTAFMRLFETLPSIDGIIIDPDAADIPEEPATLYAVCTALAMRATDQSFAAIAKYAARLTDLHGEFAALLIRDCIRKEPAVQQTPDFVRLVSGPLGQLISGGA